MPAGLSPKIQRKAFHAPRRVRCGGAGPFPFALRLCLTSQADVPSFADSRLRDFSILRKIETTKQKTPDFLLPLLTYAWAQSLLTQGKEAGGQEANMKADPILEVRHLSVTLNAEPVLQDVSFTLGAGETLAVIGPNGAGKTTLFRALLGLLPYTGVITWQKGKTLGYVPQKLSLERLVPLTGREFLLLQCPSFWRPHTTFFAHLHHELRLVGLEEEILDKPVGVLSRGQFQRLLVSWATLNHPEVLLFDEPTAGIDVGHKETIYHIMERLQQERGTTILFISHDVGVVYRHARRVLCLNKIPTGYGTPTEVLNPQALAQLYGPVTIVSPQDPAT
jgi:zinc transport system ATP-binding protein